MEQEDVNYLSFFRKKGSFNNVGDEINWVSTLQGMEGKLTHRRRDGNSTRIVDNAIQLLFQGKTIVCHDHFEYGKNNRVNEHLFIAILERITYLRSREVGGGKFSSYEVDYDKHRRIIQFASK